MQQGHPATHGFTISQRHFEWREVGSSARRSIEVTSGNFRVRIGVTGSYPSNVFLGPMIVLGTEFPLGKRAIDPPFVMSMRSYDRDRHNQIQSELVKSVVQRYCAAERFQRRPLNASFREAYALPVADWPESEAERSEREAGGRDRATALARVAEKDAKITKQRCPFCGQPCPSYRITCKHCGRNVRATG